ncbi:ribonuclease H-like domain-containing protein [Mycena albidolilacea]|uniref:Ribonuclease H-like domain-containing protein n=1 Tax=Mycena albidolilacea TaxID=1033008 RepID=A0AAD6Z5U8_9AGAR|nr:ribonuclease H-like domain-containing protein [Mycena albidolilacea]
MSGSGVTYYNEELKMLLRLLKALPDTIPEGDLHDFRHYVLDPIKMKDIGSQVLVWLPRWPGGEEIITSFQSRGPALEEVVTVLRDHITGTGGANPLLTKWVDDLTAGATHAIEQAGGFLPRPAKITDAKRRLESEAVEERADKRRKKEEKAEKAAKKDQVAVAKKRTDQGSMNWPFEDLEDDEPPAPSSGKTGQRGAPKNSLLERLVVACHSLKNPEVLRVRCVGDGCHVSWAAPRNSTRIFPHAAECKYLLEELKAEALLANASQSLGSKVATAEGKPDFFAKFKEKGAESNVSKRQARIEKTNLLTMNILCTGGIPPEIVNNSAFRALVDHLDPTNWIVIASTFSSSYIPAEAARVTALAIGKLKTEYNLNLGYDGGTTKGKQSIYTFHVMDSIGRKRFASMGSDSTGNTKLGRELAQLEVLTVLIVPDPNHHLSLTIKDICKLEYFQDLIRSIGKTRTTNTFFSHSTYSATDLDALRVIFEINKGLEAIGKTRFGTIYWSGYSLIRCVPAINNLIDNGPLAWFKQMRTFQNFMLELQQLCTILEPIARAIKCLEGIEVTVGDIWKFYVAVTAVLNDLFANDLTLSIPQTVKDDVSAIINKRYDQMIHGPSGDLFLSGFYLDPEHVKSPLLFKFSANQLSDSAPVRAASSASGKVDQDLLDSMPSYAKFVAIKIFSILGNSMPEERTVSRFTRINSKDRANQDASTIVNQTKIYQHLRREARAAGKLPEQNSKPPSLKWRTVKSLFAPVRAPIVVSDTEKAEAPRVSLTPECEVGLAVLNAVDSDEDISSSSLYSTELEQRRDGVDITLPFFGDLLSDKPIDGADAIRSIGEGRKSGRKAKNKASSTVWDGEAEKIAF